MFNADVVFHGPNLFIMPSNRLGGSGTKASKPSAHLMVTGFLEEFLQSGMPENLATKDVPTWEELAMKLRAVMESKGCKKKGGGIGLFHYVLKLMYIFRPCITNCKTQK